MEQTVLRCAIVVMMQNVTTLLECVCVNQATLGTTVDKVWLLHFILIIVIQHVYSMY